MKKILSLLLFAMISSIAFAQSNDDTPPRVTTANGTLEGTNESGIHVFRGVPFAAPPVGNLRWREPQPVKSWTGVRKADKFGPRAMQLPVFGDMNFRSNGMSEDCLYLNIWTPSKTGKDRLPVLVYFYGGGFIAGDGSEPRYDGESMSRKGIVAITVNYRLGVFGFLAHPELTKESPHHASGNYGLLDQAAAIQWVRKNIAAFGGDPDKITIAGESAGSFSVSAQMATPLAKDLIAGAIGESGSLLGLNPAVPLAQAEKAGIDFAGSVKATSLAELRTMSAEDLLKATSNAGYGRFPVCVDGYFFTKSPVEVFQSGEQSQVPLLVGWNSEEMNYRMILGRNEPTVENYKNALQKMYGEKAENAFKAYNAATNEEVIKAATTLAGDMFIGYSTWRWSDLQAKTSNKPVYRYLYSRPRPQMREEIGHAVAGLAGGVIKDSAAAKAPKAAPAQGAVHSAEIEYALGNLPTNRVYDWQPEDYKVSEILQLFFANFIKTGDPNGLGVPVWPAVSKNKTVEVMHIDVNTRVEEDKNPAQHEFMNSLLKK
jgi:para-nitrobenzyl esterase